MRGGFDRLRANGGRRGPMLAEGPFDRLRANGGRVEAVGAHARGVALRQAQGERGVRRGPMLAEWPFDRLRANGGSDGGRAVRWVGWLVGVAGFAGTTGGDGGLGWWGVGDGGAGPLAGSGLMGEGWFAALASRGVVSSGLS